MMAVGLGAGLGACLRFGLTRLGHRVWPTAPWMTLIINVTGAFVAGWVSARAMNNSQQLAFWLTGVGGGYTTFSTFNVDTVILLRNRQWLQALRYWGGSVGLGLLGAAVGLALGQSF